LDQKLCQLLQLVVQGIAFSFQREIGDFEKHVLGLVMSCAHVGELIYEERWQLHLINFRLFKKTD